MAGDIANQTSVFLGILTGIIAILVAIIGVFRYKWNQALKSEKFRVITSTDIEKMTKRIDDLCKKIDEIRKEMNREVIMAKEEHAEMQIRYQELIKELYKLIGQVTALKDK
jgi:hypothetical protein